MKLWLRYSFAIIFVFETLKTSIQNESQGCTWGKKLIAFGITKLFDSWKYLNGYNVLNNTYDPNNK